MVYNGYYKVMSNIPKMGQLPTPESIEKCHRRSFRCEVLNSLPNYLNTIIDTLWLFNIAMENSPFIDGLPIKHGDFPWLC